jgi:hypothetical protein
MRRKKNKTKVDDGMRREWRNGMEEIRKRQRVKRTRRKGVEKKRKSFRVEGETRKLYQSWLWFHCNWSRGL